jgi:hypothetical protein
MRGIWMDADPEGVPSPELRHEYVTTLRMPLPRHHESSAVGVLKSPLEDLKAGEPFGQYL